MGTGAPPECLRMYLMATGERGIGYAAVYGKTTIDTAQEWEVFWYMAQRVALAATDEGKEEIRREQSIHLALITPEMPPPVFDPLTQSAAEIARITKR